MKAIRFAIASFLFLAIFAGASMAQGVQRTFVSGLGSDSNPCSRTAPCRTFTQALMGTSARGEVYVLDSAGYGPFTITKSVTINAPQGVVAGVSVFSGDGIDINAGNSDAVTLRGLTVNNQGSCGSGIVFNSGAILHLENCVVNGFSCFGGGGFASGIVISGTEGYIFVKDSIARGNYHGMSVSPLPGTTLVAMDRLQLDGNVTGLSLASDSSGTTVHAAIRNSSLSNGGTGIDASAFHVVFLDVESCLITNNDTGIDINGFGSTVASISNCTITHNSTNGFRISSGAILTRGNNTIGGPNIGTLTALPAQ